MQKLHHVFQTINATKRADIVRFSLAINIADHMWNLYAPIMDTNGKSSLDSCYIYENDVYT